MAFDIKGKTALVTGANRGIGKALAETLLDRGAAKVYGAVRNPDSLREMVAVYGDRLVPLELDLTKPETVEAAANRASDVELVVNNAGVLRISTPLADDAIDDMKFELDANVFGLMRIAQAFAPVLKANGGGALVQLNSVASLKCFEPFATYSASKAAAYSITQALRTLLAKQGTLVVSIHPGPIATDMGDAAGFGDIAEPPRIVADAMLSALADEEFHVFPDSMAKQVGQAYQSFAKSVVEAGASEG